MKKLLSTLILSSHVSPLFVFAQIQNPDTDRNEMYRNDVQKRMEAKGGLRSNASTTRESGFCTQIDKILVQIGNGGQTSGEKRIENMEKRDEKREAVRTSVDIRRVDNEAKRKTQLDELMKRATTPEQKTAVTTFTTDMNKALLDKKTATDLIITAHRKDVDQVVASRRTVYDKALATLKTDIDAAKSKAKTDCANNVSGDSVRQNLKEAIKKAQDTFRTTLQILQKDTLAAKKDAKKVELQAVEDAFRKNVEPARKNLKEALKAQPTVTPSTTTN